MNERRRPGGDGSGGDGNAVAILSDRFGRFETTIRDALVDMRTDFRDALAQNGATLRTIVDPESGYVPRAQVQMLTDRLDERIDALDDRIQARAIVVDGRFDSLTRWIVGLGFSCAGLALTAIGVAAAAFKHP